MHEYALIDRIVKAILAGDELNGAGPVREVFLKVGTLDMHSEESFRQAFEVRMRGTPMEGARLRLEVAPASLKCSACGRVGPCPPGVADGHNPVPFAECPACGAAAAVLGGRGVEAIELSVDDAVEGETRASRTPSGSALADGDAVSK